MSRDWTEDEPLDKAAEMAEQFGQRGRQSRRQKQSRQPTLPWGLQKAEPL